MKFLLSPRSYRETTPKEIAGVILTMWFEVGANYKTVLMEEAVRIYRAVTSLYKLKENDCEVVVHKSGLLKFKQK